jgi:hypothetical protein
MTKERLDGMYLLVLGAAVCILLGGVLASIAPAKMSDFNAVFYGARCVIHHSDPYQSNQVLREFKADGGQFPSDPAISRPYQRAILSSINLPTSLLLIAPLAYLSSGTAHLLWMIFMLGSLLLAAYLMWDFGAAFAPVAAGALAGFVLANCEVLLINGNVAGVAIGLGLAALWCFINGRFTGIGVVLLAVSLAFKPHDLGFVWFYLLLAGGTLRKRAIQSLAIVILIGIPALLLISHVAPDWMLGYRSNLLLNFAHGDLNDPGPTSMGAHSIGMMVNLQTIISMFRDDPGFYNPATYLIAGPLILIWLLVTLRSQFSKERMWLALAVISSLSLLPVYHRIYDAKLLMLSIPACAMLWAEGGMIGWLALAVNSLALFFTSDLPWVFFSIILSHLRPILPWLSGSILNAIVALPAPTMLWLMSIFYLWVYVLRRSSPGARHLESGGQE